MISKLKSDYEIPKSNRRLLENIATFFASLFCVVVSKAYDERLGAIHKLRLQEEWGRWSKKLTFCKLLYHRKCKRRGVGGQKKTNLVKVVCERPLTR